MKFKEIEENVKDNIKHELQMEAMKVLMSRLKELNQLRHRVSKLEKSYNELLETDIEDITVVSNETCCNMLVMGEGIKYNGH